ncbi:MAG: ribosome recycling factor [Planctomycetes bacterium]|nr:ribosome recycling factor [Planctomycetota bacterium]
MVLLEMEDGLEKSVSFLNEQLQGLRTGRASTALVDRMMVDYYGTPTPMKQLAQIGVPEPRTIAIKPFDAGALKDIMRAIQTSDLGVNPNNDGKVVRINLPPLSEEQRKKLAAKAKDFANNTMIAMRNLRRDASKAKEEGNKGGDLTDDFSEQLQGEIDNKLKEFEVKVNDVVKKKTEEIMTI